MKIMMVAPYFYPKIGGMENYVFNISKGLKEKYGKKIVVITSNHKEKKYIEEEIEGIKIYRLPIWFKISNTPINPLWLFYIYRIIKKEQPDIINVHSPVPYISDITSIVSGKIPFITTYHSGSMIKEKNILNFLIFLYESFLLMFLFKKSINIICYSPDYIKRNLKKYGMKVKYIPPGVDMNIFKPSNQKNTNDVLYVGRIEKNSDWKGIKYLLEAILIVKQTKSDISLRLIGSGDRIEYFKKYTKKIGIDKNVKFIGVKTNKDLSKEYQLSSVTVLPSVTESESFGIVLIEAMACKKAIIGSNIGGIPYVINNKINGFLTEPKNSKQIAKAILKIISNRNLTRKLGENGYKKVKKDFTLENQVKRTHELFTTIYEKYK